MQLEAGKIYEGKVTGIKDYGAFVEIIGENVTGMVHISQISNEYVSNAREHLTEGQIVKVKFIGTNDDGKIKLSIKETLPQEQRKFNQQQKRNNNGNYQRRNNNGNNNRYNKNSTYNYNQSSDELFTKKTESSNFEDMLSKFKQDSDENLNDLKKITDRRNRSKRK
ncbi:MAG: S1 RNA-binding domain-containing protein [Ruminococcus sp.]|nr:S1 RNA-binding domain-containing protein [Ruminococcus sp.]MCD7800343.1 S1 RNA-binding domain-containing protein [Ruminococcus sp.]